MFIPAGLSGAMPASMFSANAAAPDVANAAALLVNNGAIGGLPAGVTGPANGGQPQHESLTGNDLPVLESLSSRQRPGSMTAVDAVFARARPSALANDLGDAIDAIAWGRLMTSATRKNLI